MAKLDALLAKLEVGADLRAEGGFSLDADKAREKMRQYQLADPRWYVLLLVQAAVHQGATFIEFRIDTDDMEVEFDGTGFTEQDLEDLYAAMWGAHASAQLEARRQLALALNAVMAINPRYVRLHSQGLGGGVDAQLFADRPDVLEGLPPTESGRTKIHVKERFRLGLVVNFFRDMRGTLAEEVLLRERCRRARLPIVLDGQRISHGLELGDGMLVHAQVDAPSISGQVGFFDLSDKEAGDVGARLELLSAGVWLVSHTLSGFPVGFVAQIDHVNLTRDMSQFDVVKDSEYQRLLDVLRTKCDALLVDVALGLCDGTLPAAADKSWVRQILLAHVAKSGVLQPFTDPVVTELLKVPFWETVVGQRKSLSDIQQLSGRVDVVNEQPPVELPKIFVNTLIVPRAQERAALQVLFPERLRDRNAAARRAVEHENKRLAFMKRAHSGFLGEGNFRWRVSFEHDDIRGEVGLLQGWTLGSSITVVVDGRRLEHLDIPYYKFPLNGLVAVICGPFRPGWDWDKAHRTHDLARALHLMLEQLAQQMQTIDTLLDAEPAALADPSKLLPYAQLVATGQLDEALYTAVGFSKSPAAKASARLGTTQPCIDLRAGGVANLKFFRTISGKAMSLAEVERQRKGKPILVIDKTQAGSEHYPLFALRVHEREQDLLRAVFGKATLKNHRPAYERWLKEHKWAKREQVELELSAKVILGPHAFELDGVRGVVGLRCVTAAQLQHKSTGKFRLLKRMRLVGEFDVVSPLPGIVITFNDDRVELNSEGNLSRGRHHRRYNELALQATADLLEEFLDDPPETLDPNIALVLLALAAVPFERPGWLDGYLRLRQEGLELAERRLGSLARAWDQLGGDLSYSRGHSLLDGEGYERTIRSSRKLPAGHPRLRDFRKNVLALLPKVEALELLAGTRGPLTLAQVFAQLERHNRVYRVSKLPQPSASPGLATPELVLCCTEAQDARLQQLLTVRLLDGEAYLEQCELRSVFEHRVPLASIELRDSDVFVRIDVDVDGIRGQIGIPRKPCAQALSSIVVCSQARQICEVTPTTGATVAIVGILDGPFGHSTDYASLSSSDQRNVDEACSAHIPELLATMCRQWERIAGEDFSMARSWVIAAVRADAEGTRGRVRRMSPLTRALADLDIFVTLGGSRCSLSDLGRRVTGAGPLLWVGTGDAGLPGTKDTVIVVESEYELDFLRDVFGRVDSYLEAIEARAAAHERIKCAPKLPNEPRSPLALVGVNGRGLKGSLWLTHDIPQDAQIALGNKGKLCAHYRVSQLLPCLGAVWGKGVKISQDWSEVDIKQRQRERLQDLTVDLYLELVEHFEAELAGPPKTVVESLRKRVPWAGKGVELEATRHLLLEVGTRLQQARASGQKPKSSRLRRLSYTLFELPLVPIGDGHFVSLREREPRAQAKSEQQEDQRAALVVPEIPVPGLKPEPEPELELEPEPTSQLPVPEVTAEQWLKRAVIGELTLVRHGNERLLSFQLLEGLEFAELPKKVLAMHDHYCLRINSEHPVVAAALREHALSQVVDPILVSLIASSTYSAVNIWCEEITDTHESTFLRLHAELLASGRR